MRSQCRIKNETQTSGRNSAIELVRIIAAIGVVILHYNLPGMGGGMKYVGENTLNKHYLFFSEGLFICAVNLFIMISAYFLSKTQKRRMSKVFDLIFQVVAFKVIGYTISILNGNSYSVKQLLFGLLPDNYFVILYSALYIISPYINILIKKASKDCFKKLVLTLFLLFSVYTILVDLFALPAALSTVSSSGSQGGYTVVNFVLVYIIGAYIRENDINISKKSAYIGILACLIFIFAQANLENWFLRRWPTAWNYNHPAVIIMPAFIILLFKNFKFESKVINELAKAGFTCYLFHGFFMTRLMVEQFVNRSVFILIVHQIGSAMILYALSYIVYKIYNFLTVPVRKYIYPIVDKCDISVTDN